MHLHPPRPPPPPFSMGEYAHQIYMCVCYDSWQAKLTQDMEDFLDEDQRKWCQCRELHMHIRKCSGCRIKWIGF